MATISGTVKDSAGALAQRLVRVYRRDTGALVAEGLSNPTTGIFSLTTADATKHFVVVHDSDSWITYLPMNGANNSTVFSEWSGKASTTFGNAKISTAQSKFGGASGLFDGTGDYVSMAGAADLHPGAGDLTVECQIRTAAIGAIQRVCGFATSGGGNSTWVLSVSAGGNIVFSSYDGTSAKSATSTSTITANTWVHVAGMKVGNVLKVAVAGVIEATSAALVANPAAFPSPFSIGRMGDYDSQYFNGYIDDLLITKGRAKYTADFTPPTVPHSDLLPMANAVVYDFLTPG